MAEKDGGDASPPNAGPAKNGPKPSESDSSGVGLTQGFEVAAGIGLGVVVGTWWDKHHNSAPWGLLIGLLVGCAAGMYLLIKEAMRANK